MVTSLTSSAKYSTVNVKDGIKDQKQAKMQDIRATDESKLNKIAKDIQSGNYKVDLHSLASKIADELI